MIRIQLEHIDDLLAVWVDNRIKRLDNITIKIASIGIKKVR